MKMSERSEKEKKYDGNLPALPVDSDDVVRLLLLHGAAVTFTLRCSGGLAFKFSSSACQVNIPTRSCTVIPSRQLEGVPCPSISPPQLQGTVRVRLRLLLQEVVPAYCQWRRRVMDSQT